MLKRHHFDFCEYVYTTRKLHTFGTRNLKKNDNKDKRKILKTAKMIVNSSYASSFTY